MGESEASAARVKEINLVGLFVFVISCLQSLTIRERSTTSSYHALTCTSTSK